MRMQKTVWDLKQRQILENLLHEGLNIPRIAKAMNLTTQTIYKEIQKGVTLEEYAQGRYIKYTAERSIENQIEQFRKYLIEGKQD